MMRRITALPSLLLLGRSLVCALGIFASVAMAQPVSQQEPARSMEEIRQLLQENQAEKAWQQASALMHQYPLNHDVNFYYGRAAYATGRYAHALFAYERLLGRNPLAHRVRLETGRTYLALNQPENAQRHFEEVLRHDPPPAVRRNVEHLLEQVSRKQQPGRLSGSLSAGLFHDSNVNFGLSSSLGSDLDQILDFSSLKSRSDQGVFAMAGVVYDHRLATVAPWYVTGGAQYYHRGHLDEDDSDLGYARLFGGFWTTGARSMTQVLLKYEDIRLGSEKLSTIVGLEPTYVYSIAPELRSLTALVVERRDQRNNERDSDYLSLQETLRWQYHEGGDSISGSLRLAFDDAEEKEYSSRLWEVRLEHERRVDLWSGRGLMGAHYREVVYGSEGRVPVDSLGTLVKRDDTQIALYASAQRELRPGLLGEIRLQYTDNDSNHPLQHYDKTVFSVAAHYRF
ncbi:hypothetical protein Selin_2056 [Desulfurispirillum indicum S5]|uniref:Surface lipoprotein assembly modifier C-terminal domain-containing protein n=1 Tax=Desulfurispirillum indicum (strain ATCC BAA-1389 / DSM 22839 / S5) TaxID=653733 RepID=E6W2V1_DESIS|nr:tetratricopeptide repeat protein [Desulfurispirillum indicum]ADU66776.1 hypothetical protein Selin_2056 [Desulfurispirillum indicum S5]